MQVSETSRFIAPPVKMSSPLRFPPGDAHGEELVEGTDPLVAQVVYGEDRRRISTGTGAVEDGRSRRPVVTMEHLGPPCAVAGEGIGRSGEKGEPEEVVGKVPVIRGGVDPLPQSEEGGMLQEQDPNPIHFACRLWAHRVLSSSYLDRYKH